MAAAPSGTPALPDGLFRYVWQWRKAQQVWLCLLTAVVFPLTIGAARLQRRIIDDRQRFPASADRSRDLLAYYRLAAET